ncbi:tyrosine-type recombinase/integrase [bacterium]|jgi:integrase|nr:tyrosine-type recombinase/integrase [bacterium]
MKLQKTKIAGIYTKKLQNNDVSYYGNYRNPITKRPVRKKLGSKLKDNIKNAKHALVILDAHIDNLKSPTNAIEQVSTNYKKITLNELAKLYFQSRVKRKTRILKEQFNYLSDDDFTNSQAVKSQIYNTEKEYFRYKKNVSIFRISDIPIKDITKLDINNYIEVDLSKTSLGQKSKFNVVSQIKTIVNYGIKQDIIYISNPFKNVSFRNPKRQRERVLSIIELDKLLKTCKTYKNNINVYLSVYLAVLTGGRANTILNIRKKDIDIANQTISLSNFKANRKYKITITSKANEWLKNKIIPYFESEEFIIRPIHEFNRKDTPQALSVIPKKVYDIMDELFNQHLNKSNNDDRDKVVNFHTIRRSVATNLAKSGTPLYDVMIFLNHSNIEQTMKYLNMESNNLNKQVDSLMEDIFKDF